MVDNRLAGRRDRCSAPQHARGAIKLSGGSGPMPMKAGQLVRALWSWASRENASHTRVGKRLEILPSGENVCAAAGWSRLRLECFELTAARSCQVADDEVLLLSGAWPHRS